MKVTLNQIKKLSPCCSGWETLLKAQGKTRADNVPFEASAIVDSNGIDDTLWVLQRFGKIELIRRFGIWCARQVQHLMTDERSIKALDVAEAYLDGKVTKKELAYAAADAARAADATTHATRAADATTHAARAYAADAAHYAASTADDYADADCLDAYYTAYYAADDAAADACQAQKTKLKTMIDKE